MVTESPEESGGLHKVRPLYDELAGSPPESPIRMQQVPFSKRLLRLWPIWGGIALAFCLLVWSIRYHGAAFGPIAIAHKLETLAALRVSLLRSVESEQRAVMADTDEASHAFAQESRQASAAVEAERNELAELIKLSPSEDENRLLHEFDESWEQMRTLDRQILELAVQNTNLKAAALSFGEASAALHRFQADMQILAHDTDNLIIVRLASDALAAVLTIQTLHAPHIASADDVEMSRIEETIREQEAVARRCLEQLTQFVPSAKRNDVSHASTALGEYMALTKRVIELSRQNTNVTSLEISLNRKRKMTAQCDVIIGKLQDAIKGRDYKATR
jgi:hypothetical protein